MNLHWGSYQKRVRLLSLLSLTCSTDRGTCLYLRSKSLCYVTSSSSFFIFSLCWGVLFRSAINHNYCDASTQKYSISGVNIGITVWTWNLNEKSALVVFNRIVWVFSVVSVLPQCLVYLAAFWLPFVGTECRRSYHRLFERTRSMRPPTGLVLMSLYVLPRPHQARTILAICVVRATRLTCPGASYWYRWL